MPARTGRSQNLKSGNGTKILGQGYMSTTNTDLWLIKLYVKQNILLNYEMTGWGSYVFACLLLLLCLGHFGLVVLSQAIWQTVANTTVMHRSLRTSDLSPALGTHAGHLFIWDSVPLTKDSSLFIFQSYFHNFQHEVFRGHSLGLTQPVWLQPKHFSPPSNSTECPASSLHPCRWSGSAGEQRGMNFSFAYQKCHSFLPRGGPSLSQAAHPQCPAWWCPSCRTSNRGQSIVSGAQWGAGPHTLLWRAYWGHLGKEARATHCKFMGSSALTGGDRWLFPLWESLCPVVPSHSRPGSTSGHLGHMGRGFPGFWSLLPNWDLCPLWL